MAVAAIKNIPKPHNLALSLVGAATAAMIAAILAPAC
jgi:hypothetical protein